ncbi:Pre-mRNA-processing factor [Lachnellula hyalina]|uniref:Pre-mRNA-processing factor 19 n=1 Tax=Lachnellula hyalina TaxID=1316788 RepID=A0A8H8U2W2_9HELO|nr:Pre-mRNA-processing factor [Lachnellula hyalina]TVY29408.1 Pre-mRNA-processing factor [Lachnellula hyalina]
MLCSISGEAPQHPVASSKSGNVYEKRLIEQYISENHKDPVNGEELEVTDLIDLKSARIVTPRPPTLTSIPSLLTTFQNEWDALALESFKLRQQLNQTRQELTTALYQQDAAIRVIAKLTRERDEARDALSKVTVGAGASNGDAMQIDSQGLPEELAAKVDATQEKLSKSRRKRPVPQGWADTEAVEKFNITTASKPLYPGASAIAVDEAGELVLSGGSDGIASVYSIADNKVQQTLEAGAAITDAVWYGSQPVVSTSSGTVKVFGDGEITFTSHAGKANGLALHPSGDILASVGVDKSFVLYDLQAGKAVTQIYTDSELTTAAFHPDGHLFAAGGADGQIKLFHVNTGENAANFDLGGSVQDLAFSENGIWFAAVARGSPNVVIFDLRKEGKAAEAKVLEIGGQVDSLRWDYSGDLGHQTNPDTAQFLAASGPGGFTISQYTKASKKWDNVISLAVPATAVAWGPEAKTLVTVNGKDGVVTVLG